MGVKVIALPPASSRTIDDASAVQSMTIVFPETSLMGLAPDEVSFSWVDLVELCIYSCWLPIECTIGKRTSFTR